MAGNLLKRVATAARPRPSRLRVTLDLEFSSREALAHAMVGDSLEVTTDTPLPLGLQIDLRVSFPGLAAPVELCGEVRWSTHGGGGEDAAMRIALAWVPRELRTELRQSGTQPVASTMVSVPRDEPWPASRIIVLESNAVMRELMQYAFQSVAARKALPNVQAEFTSSVDTCRAMLAAGRSLLIVDLDSVSAGLALLNELRESNQFADTPVLALTAGTAPPRDDLTLVLRKPIALDRLLKGAELLLAASRRSR